MNARTKLHSYHTQAERLGWTIIKAHAIRGGGYFPPGAITLCEVGGHHPYVVHFFNAQDGGFHGGMYCNAIKAALEAFEQRIRRVV